MRMRLLVGAAVLFFAIDASATRFEVTSAGAPVEGAEVCLFAAADRIDPVARYFTRPAVTCRAANADTAIPNGDWNVYARRGKDLISDRAELLSSSAKSLRFELFPAARVNVSEPAKGSVLVAWIPRTQSAVPIVDGVVPADTLVLPVIVKGGKIAATAEPLTIATGSTANIAIATPAEKRANVLVPVVIRSVPEEGSTSPVIVLTDRAGSAHKSELPIRTAAKDAVALAFFRNVLAEAATIAATGSRWKSADVKIDPKGGLLVSDRPVTVDATSKLTVHWWMPLDPASLRVDSGACDAPEPPSFRAEEMATGKTFKVTLSISVDPRSRPVQYVEFASRELPMNELKGNVEFEGVPAGPHYLEFAFPGLPVVSRPVDVTTKSSSEADAEVNWLSFFGCVTRGGKPVHARIFATVTDPQTGRYVAVVTHLPGKQMHYISSCDGKFSPYKFVPDVAPVENAAYDVDIPENEVSVDVADKKSCAPVQGATIRLAAAMPDDQSKRAMHFAGPADGPNKTDENGHVTIGPVLTNRELLICAEQDDYLTGCAERFTMKEASKSIRIELEKSLKLRGLVSVGVALEKAMAMVVWFTPSGEIDEMVRKIAPDGTFVYTKAHAEGQVAAFISAVTPLYVFLQPHLDDGEIFQIAFPPVRTRSFAVSIPEGSPMHGNLGLKVGDLFVSLNALAWHLGPRLHAVNLLMSPGKTLQIPDILETGPISAVLIPDVPPSSSGPYFDPMFGPARNSYPRKPLGEANAIVFE